MLVLRLYGNTYPIKGELKACKFRWDNDEKCWWKNFNSNEFEYVKNLAEAYENGSGICAEIAGDIERYI